MQLVRTDQEGSEHAQWKIEETIQYWVAQEKKAAMNYCHALELNDTVSNKRVQQLYSEDQLQEVIDQAERQAGSARWTLESIQRVDKARLSRHSPKHPRTPRATGRHKYYAKNNMQVMYGESQERMTQPVQAIVPDTERYRSPEAETALVYVSNKRSWLSWSNNAHAMQRTRRELGRWSRWFNHHVNEIEYKSPWRIFWEFRSQSIWDVCHRNTVMAKVTWPIRC